MRTTVAAIGLSVLATMGTAACGGPQSPEFLPGVTCESIDQTADSGTMGPATETMQITYEYAYDADQQRALLQCIIGAAATKAMVGVPVTIELDGQQRTTTESVPADPAARQQTIIFTGDANQAGKIFVEHGLPGGKDITYSATAGAVDESTFDRYGPATSVVSQETKDAHYAATIVVERCQAMNAKATPPFRSIADYTYVKDADCNTRGWAAIAMVQGKDYPEYVKSVTRHRLVSPTLGNHLAVMRPVSDAVYSSMQSEYLRLLAATSK